MPSYFEAPLMRGFDHCVQLVSADVHEGLKGCDTLIGQELDGFPRIFWPRKFVDGQPKVSWPLQIWTRRVNLWPGNLTCINPPLEVQIGVRFDARGRA